MKYIVLFIMFMMLSACSDISDSQTPDNFPPSPLGGSSTAPIEIPSRNRTTENENPGSSENNDSGDIIFPSDPSLGQDTEVPQIPEDNTIAPPENDAGNPPASEPVPEILTEISTHLYDDSENRVNNIKIASEAISGTVLAPGDVFSFNDTVGKRSAEKGYKKAPILSHGKHSKGFGGGVCQVSTTLYLAANDCGFEILERHRHDKKVAYAPNGNDCTVNYNDLDLKFKNNSDKTVRLEIYVDGEEVVAKILTEFSI